MQEVKIILGAQKVLKLSPGLLEEVESIEVRMSGHEQKVYDLRWDGDGLLTVRGAGENGECFTPVLTPGCKWVLRDAQGVREIELDEAPIPELKDYERIEYGTGPHAAKTRQAKRLRQMGGSETREPGEVA